MEPDGLQARFRFDVMSNLESAPVYSLEGVEAVASIPLFHDIESHPDKTGESLAWDLLRVTREVALAFKADG